MAYRDFKYLPRKATSDNGLRGKAFEIAKDPKYDGYQRGLASMVYKLFDKKSRKSVTFATHIRTGTVFEKVPENQESANE